MAVFLRFSQQKPKKDCRWS